jgi:putative endonuclease
MRFHCRGRKKRLFIGVTKNLEFTVWQLQQGLLVGCPSEQGPWKLVRYEWFSTMREASDRVSELEDLGPKAKRRIVSESNPNWRDLGRTAFPHLLVIAGANISAAELALEELLREAAEGMSMEELRELNDLIMRDFPDFGDASGGVGARVPVGPRFPPRSFLEAKEIPLPEADLD